jgi:hypothetical protein
MYEQFQFLNWVKQTLDACVNTAEIRNGKLFRCVWREGTVWGTEGTEKQSCARFCHDSGGELEQIQFLLRHVSVQTTEKYLGYKQRFREAVNDRNRTCFQLRK